MQIHISNSASKLAALSATYGPWALDTAASDGIGLGFAVRLATRGTHLILLARQQEAHGALAIQLCAAHSAKCGVVVADLSTPAGVNQVLESTADLDVELLVCSAGFAAAGSILRSDNAVELNTRQVNCTALTELSWRVSERLVARRRGCVTLLSWPQSGNRAAFGTQQLHGYGHAWHDGASRHLTPQAERNHKW